MTALPESPEPAERGLVGAPGTGADGVAGPSDAELLTRVRDGDKRAFGALWDRHHRAGLHAARAITTTFDADDLVSEAFVRVLKAIEHGNGPTAAFRPYLVTTIRSVAARWGARPAELTPDEFEVVDPDSSDEAFGERFDQSLTVRAFNTLPQRWQEVLWYTEAEQLPPREVAALIGIKPNAVSALAKRAKEGLRHAWVQAHIATVPAESECRWSIDRLAASTRKSLPAREQQRLDAHLEECDRCPLAAAEMTEASHRLGALILIGFLGAGAATAYGAMLKPAAAMAAALGAGAVAGKSGGAAGAAAGKATLARNVSIGAGAAVAAAAVAAAVAFGTGAIGSSHHSAPAAAVAAAGSSSSGGTSSPSSSSRSPSAKSPAAAGDSSGQASAAVSVSVVDTGNGLYYPIITGAGEPGSAVTASQVASPSAGASTQRSGRMGVLRPSLAHPGSVVAEPAMTLARHSSTTVSTAGKFTLGPLSWLQPDGSGEARVRIEQRSPSGAATSTVVTVKLPKQSLALSAPLTSGRAQLMITGAKGATVDVRFSDGTTRSVVLDAGSGRGSVAVPAGATSATVVYADRKTGRFGRAQTVQLADLAVVSAATGPAAGSTSTPAPGSPKQSDPGTGNGPGATPDTGTGTGSTPGSGQTTPPTSGDNNGNDGTATPAASQPVTGVTANTGNGFYYPIITGAGVSGATVYAVVGTGQPDLSSAPSAVVSSGAFALPELNTLPAGQSTVTLYQLESGSSTLSAGVSVTVTLAAPTVTPPPLLSSTATVTGVPNMWVEVGSAGLLSSGSSSIVQLDGTGKVTVSVSGLLGGSVSASYVDGQAATRRGPESSAVSLLGL